jgi:hypothetical protein
MSIYLARLIQKYTGSNSPNMTTKYLISKLGRNISNNVPNPTLDILKRKKWIKYRRNILCSIADKNNVERVPGHAH